MYNVSYFENLGSSGKTMHDLLTDGFAGMKISDFPFSDRDLTIGEILLLVRQ